MKNKFGKIFPLVIGVLLINFFAYSQIREAGTILGNITDEAGDPLPGVTVTVESPDLLGGSRSLVTDAEGFYNFRTLSLGIYKVTAMLSGLNTLVKEGLRIHQGLTLTCDFTMSQATVEEEIIVIGEAPSVDFKSAQPRAVVLTDELLLALPISKSYSGLLFLAPGDDFYSPYGGGYGSTSAWQFDGVDVSDPGWGGISFRVDFNVIKEATVQGLGLPAEYGMFTGAVMTAVSKSGSNRFSTLNEFWYHGNRWNSQNHSGIDPDTWFPGRDPGPGYRYSTLPYYDIGVQGGGKLIHDKLWLFASGELDRAPVPVLYRTEQVTANRKLYGKLTFQLNPSNKMNTSLMYSKQLRDGGGSVLYPDGMWLDTTFYNLFSNLSWTSIISPKTFLDVKFGFYQYYYTQYPNLGIEIPGIRDTGTGLYSQNLQSYNGSRTWNYTYSAHLNHYIPEFIKGSHDLKLGAEMVHFKFITENGYSGGYTLTYRFGVPVTKVARDARTYDNYATVWTGFLQDRWTVAKRLVLNLGLRYDHYSYRVPVEGRGTIYKNPAISPRVGLTYDLLGDRKNVFKLHYAHYSENINRNQFASRFDPRRSAGVTVYDWDAALDDWVFNYETSVSVINASVSPDVSHPYIKEISGGFERELFRNASLAINFYNRSIGAGFYYFNVAAEYTSTTATNPGPDNIIGTADDLEEVPVFYETNPGEYVYMVMNPHKGSPEWLTIEPSWYCRGIEVIFTKRFSNKWGLIASYHYTRSRGNSTGAMVGLYDPNYIYNSYGVQGGAYYSQPHQFKISGNVTLPLDIQMGINARAMSGRALSRPRYRFPTPAGSKWVNLEAYGDFILDPRYDFDIRLQKVFTFGGLKLHVMGDIFNVLNNHDGNNGIYYAYGPYYHKRLSLKDPRTFQIGLRIIY